MLNAYSIIKSKCSEDKLMCIINAKYASCSQHTVDLEDCDGILNSSFSITTLHALSDSFIYEKVGGGSSDIALYICFEAKMHSGVGYFTLRHRVTMAG